MVRKVMLVVALAVMVAGGFLLMRRGGDGPSSGGGEGVAPGPSARPRAPVVKRAADPPQEPVVVDSMVAHAELLNAEDATVEEDLSVVGELINAYIRYVGTAPEGGLNEEIVACLQGQNPRKLIVLGRRHARVNSAGELLDRHGTPDYFHPVSAKEIEVRSAGPDQLLWSEDDVLLP